MVWWVPGHSLGRLQAALDAFQMHQRAGKGKSFQQVNPGFLLEIKKNKRNPISSDACSVDIQFMISTELMSHTEESERDGGIFGHD